MSKRGREESSFPAVVDEARRIYNHSCSNKPSLDAKGGDRTKEAVAKKIADFCACFAPSAKVFDLVSGKPILADQQQLKTRFATVFRESGPSLELANDGSLDPESEMVISPNAAKIIDALLQPDPAERLGGPLRGSGYACDDSYAFSSCRQSGAIFLQCAHQGCPHKGSNTILADERKRC